MKLILSVAFILGILSLSLSGVSMSSKPNISLKMLDRKYDFTNRMTYGDIYIEKSAADACVSDTCYQEHTVKIYCLKKDVVTTKVVEKTYVSPQTIVASTNPTSTFIGKWPINDGQYFYEYYVDEGESYMAVNASPISMRYFPDKHLNEGHYALQFDTGCFNGRVTIFRGSGAVDNAKFMNHKVRVYYRVGVNSENPQDFSTVFEPDMDILKESVTFVGLPDLPCKYISFYQVTDVEVEK